MIGIRSVPNGTIGELAATRESADKTQCLKKRQPSGERDRQMTARGAGGKILTGTLIRAGY